MWGHPWWLALSLDRFIFIIPYWLVHWIIFCIIFGNVSVVSQALYNSQTTGTSKIVCKFPFLIAESFPLWHNCAFILLLGKDAVRKLLLKFCIRLVSSSECRAESSESIVCNKKNCMVCCFFLTGGPFRMSSVGNIIFLILLSFPF